VSNSHVDYAVLDEKGRRKARGPSTREARGRTEETHLALCQIEDGETRKIVTHRVLERKQSRF